MSGFCKHSSTRSWRDGGGILDTLLWLFEDVEGKESWHFLLNWDATICCRDLLFSPARSLSQLALYMAEINFQMAWPISISWGNWLISLLVSEHCFINMAILWREHEIFFTLPLRHSSTLSRETGVKFPSHRLGSTGPLVWYRMMVGSVLGYGSMVLCSVGWELDIVWLGMASALRICLCSWFGGGGEISSSMLTWLAHDTLVDWTSILST